jgi:hypothetical protein
VLHRRLTALALLAAGLCSGCLPLLTWRPAVRGRLIDELTGRPVPGVRITPSYHEEFIASDSREVREGHAVTDANGEFFVPGHWMFRLLLVGTLYDFEPRFVVSFPPYEQPVYCCFRVERSGRRSYSLTLCSSRPCRRTSPQPGGFSGQLL